MLGAREEAHKGRNEGKHMQIRITHKGSEDFYREVVNVLSQYRRIVRKPTCKLRNTLRSLSVYLVVCLVMLAIELALSLAWGFDLLDGIALGMLSVTALFCGVFLHSMRRMLRELSSDARASVLTLDDEGVELAKEGGQVVRMAWDSVAFIRVFDESFCVMMRERTGFVIAVDRRYEVEVLDWMALHQPDVLIVRAAA
jgi:hypothetical protein